jgi:hypothetical protein
MGDIVEFLKARLAEDEAAAQRAGAWHPDWTYDRETFSVNSGTWSVAARRANDVPLCDVDGEHVARHDPARVLRDIAAKRAIIDLHRSVPLVDGAEGTTCAECGPTADDHAVWAFPGEDWTPCRTLKILAAIWAEHPDYDPSWTVAG